MSNQLVRTATDHAVLLVFQTMSRVAGILGKRRRSKGSAPGASGASRFSFDGWMIKILSPLVAMLIFPLRRAIRTYQRAPDSSDEV